MSSQTSAAAVHPHKEVRLQLPSTRGSTIVESEKRKASVKFNPQTWKWPDYLAWVPSKLNWQALKPVVRSSIASWIVSPTQ
jgi:hypothetical protein